MLAQAAGVHGAHTHGRVLGASASEAALAAAARAAAAAGPEFAADLPPAALGSGSGALPPQAEAAGSGDGAPAVIVLNQLEVGPQPACPLRVRRLWLCKAGSGILMGIGAAGARPVWGPEAAAACEVGCACHIPTRTWQVSPD